MTQPLVAMCGHSVWHMSLRTTGVCLSNLCNNVTLFTSYLLLMNFMPLTTWLLMLFHLLLAEFFDVRGQN